MTSKKWIFIFIGAVILLRIKMLFNNDYALLAVALCLAYVVFIIVAAGAELRVNSRPNQRGLD